MSQKKRTHLQYKGSGYVDVGICAPWDWRSKEVTTDESQVDCLLCRRFIAPPAK